MTISIKDVDLDHPDVFCAQTQFQHAGDIAQTALFDALRAQGIPEYVWPKAPSEHVVLGRAVKACARRQDRVEPISDGWVLTLVHRDKLDLEDPGNTGKDAHEVCVTAKVLRVGESRVVRITPEDSLHGPLIRHEYEYQSSQFKASEDISKWLSQTIIPWVGGVAAKARGGAYYVMKGTGLTNIQKVKAALDSVSEFHTKAFPVLDKPGQSFYLPCVSRGTNVILKPEFGALEAVRIMLNGIIEEAETVCDDLHEKLVAAKLGPKGLKTQIEVASDLENKLATYSQALGLDLGDINARLLELKTGLGMALIRDTEL